MFSRVRRTAVALIACAVGVGGLCGVALGQGKPKEEKPGAEATHEDYAVVCNGLTGATAAEKVIACTNAIKSGKLTGGELALAYLNRGLSESGKGSDVRAKADYKSSVRILTDAIMAAPTNPYLYILRGSVYQSIGEADRAIIDYSDAIRMAPRQTYPLINRAIVLYSKKDNNDGAIADLTAALRLNSKEISAWVNRGIVYRKKNDFTRAMPDFDEAIKLLPPNLDPVRTKYFTDAATTALGKQDLEKREVASNNTSLLAAFAHLQRGMALYDLSEYDKAIADFSEAIRLNPKNAAPWVNRGWAYLRKENFKEAIADFSEAIKAAPAVASSYIQRGIAYHRAGESDKAIDDYTKAHELAPRDPLALVNRGIVLYTKKGKFDEAIEDFDKALKVSPKDISALVNRGVTYRQKNDPDRAIVDFDRALKLGRTTAEILKSLIRADGTRDPTMAELADQVSQALYQRGMAYLDKLEYDAAFVDFDNAMKLTPKDPRPFLGRGAAFLKMDEPRKAITDLDAAIKLAPDQAYVYFERGTAFHRVEDYRRALADYTQSIKIDPKEPLAYINRGMAETFLGELDAAIDDFDTALSYAPDNVNAYVQRGYAYALRQEFAKAFADVNEALRLTPDNPTARYYLGLIHMLRGDADRALAELIAAARLDPTNSRIFGSLAAAYSGRGDYTSAIENLDRLIKLRPKDPVNYLNRGIAYFSKGDYEKAIADYTSALGLDPKMIPALNNRCMAFTVIGKDLTQARADCDEVMKLMPRDPYLPSHEEGHARFDGFDLSTILFLQKMSDRGIGPKHASEIADIAARGVFLGALNDPAAYEGDPIDDFMSNPTHHADSVVRKTGKSKHRKNIPARFLIIWADGSEWWDQDIHDAIDRLKGDQIEAKLGGPCVFLDQYETGKLIAKRAGRPLVHVERVETK